MTATLQVTYKDFPAPLLAEERIRERFDRLERIYPRMTSCRVVAEELDARPHQGKLYQLRIDVVVPGRSWRSATASTTSTRMKISTSPCATPSTRSSAS
jgi:hypothetical protein